MKKRRRRRRSPPKVSRYRRVVGRLPHSMVALAVVTVGLTFGLASVGWAVDGKPLLAGRTNTATQPTVLDKAGAGPALNLQVDSGPALAVNTTDLVTNLNADQLDGMGENAFAKTGHEHSGGDITSGTVGESFIDDAITRDSEVPSLVGISFATQSALNEEIEDRQQWDQTLQANIDGESAARAAADTTLQSNIDQEASTRQNADNALGQGDGAANEPSDPVDFTKVNNIPADVINRNADTIDGKNSSDFASAYQRTVVVSPAGTPQQNGTALKNALAGITDGSATNPYLLKIEPGVYDLGSSDTPLTMKPWVDVEGSGEGVTTLTASASGNFLTGTVEGAANSELRFLTVKNTGGASYATAIRSSANPFRLTHVTATASGGNLINNPVNITGGTATLSQVNASASEDLGNIKIAVSIHPGSTATLNQVNASASGNNINYGVNITGGTATLSEVNASASGINVNYGVGIGNGTATLSQVDANASGGGTNQGISNNNSNTQVRNSRIASSNETIVNFAGTVEVGTSQLAGGAVSNSSGTIKCVASYDENYDALGANCDLPAG